MFDDNHVCMGVGEVVEMDGLLYFLFSLDSWVSRLYCLLFFFASEIDLRSLRAGVYVVPN